MLLRPKTAYEIPIPVALATELADFEEELMTAPFNLNDTMGALHSVLVQLWMTEWVTTAQNTMPDPTMRALALLSLREDGTHKDAKSTTGPLAQLEYNIRLTALREIHNLSRDQFNGNQNQARLEVERWFVEKNNSTFNSVRSLQHRASFIAYSTMSMPRIFWTDRETYQSMLYKGYSVTLPKIRESLRLLEENQVSQWETKVLLGTNLRVPYDGLVEDLTNEDAGYSFLNDRRNLSLADADSSALAEAILRDPELSARFTLSFDGSRPEWNRPALHEWLRHYAKHSLWNLLHIAMTIAGPARGSELVEMAYINRRTTLRSLRACDDFLTLFRFYTKTDSVMGIERRIPHALDSFSKDLNIQDLTIARPFAMFAAKLCYPEKREVLERFKTHLFVNLDKSFVTDDLSNEMAKLLFPIFGFRCTVGDWRHIEIAFQRRRCGARVRLLEETEHDSIFTLLAGNSDATSNRIYSRSQDSVDGCSEDLIPQFLQASTEWQVEVRVVPGE